MVEKNSKERENRFMETRVNPIGIYRIRNCAQVKYTCVEDPNWKH